MPTVRRIGSARFFFHSNERTEPPHIHIEQVGAVAKFWLDPVCGIFASFQRAGVAPARAASDGASKRVLGGVLIRGTASPDSSKRAV